jgi:hypothetical protein
MAPLLSRHTAPPAPEVESDAPVSAVNRTREPVSDVNKAVGRVYTALNHIIVSVYKRLGDSVLSLLMVTRREGNRRRPTGSDTADNLLCPSLPLSLTL